MTSSAQQKREWKQRNPEAVRAERHRRVNDRRVILRFVKAQPCADCDERYPYYVMDLDHVRGRKVGPVSALANVRSSMAAFIAEILKCDVVCANCHRERTHGEVSDLASD